MNVIGVQYENWNENHLQQLLITIKGNMDVSSLNLGGSGLFTLDLQELWTLLLRCNNLKKLSIVNTEVNEMSMKLYAEYLSHDRLEEIKYYFLHSSKSDKIILRKILYSVLISLKNLHVIDYRDYCYINDETFIFNVINNSYISTFILYGYSYRCGAEYILKNFNRSSPVSLLLFYRHDVYTCDYSKYENLLIIYPQILRLANKFHEEPSYLQSLQDRNIKYYNTVINYKSGVDVTIRGLYKRGDPQKITSHRSILEIIARKATNHDYLELLDALDLYQLKKSK